MKPPPLKGLNLRIPFILPIKRMGFINHGSTLGIYLLLQLKGLTCSAYFGVCVYTYTYEDILHVPTMMESLTCGAQEAQQVGWHLSLYKPQHNPNVKEQPSIAVSVCLPG